MGTPVVLSYGLGADSTAILLRWLEDPSSRDFDLQDLIVITAMVGDEFRETGELVQAHILPRLREHGVRFVQVAKGGRLQKDGIVVMSDSRRPTQVHLDGVYKLSQEMQHAYTVPQYRAYARKCSIKFKGWVLDTWLEGELQGRPFRHVMGFESEETKRAEKDTSYSTEQRTSEYPLIKWDWNRQACIDYIQGLTGVIWPKSCCEFCPFSQGNAEHLARLAAAPDRAMGVLMMEHMSLAFNARQSSLPGNQTFASKLEEAGYAELLAKFQSYRSQLTWGVFRVRRVFTGPNSAHRSITRETSEGMTQVQAEAHLHKLAKSEGVEVETEAGFLRAHLSRREDKAVFPSIENMLVACPAHYAPGDPLAEGKTMPSFQKHWDQATETLGKRDDLPSERPSAAFFKEPLVKVLGRKVRYQAGVAVDQDSVVPEVLREVGLDPENPPWDLGTLNLPRLVQFAFRNQREEYCGKKAPLCVLLDRGQWALTPAGVEKARTLQ